MADSRKPVNSELIYSDVEFEQHRSRRKNTVICVGAWIFSAALLPWIVLALLKGLVFLVILDLVGLASAALTLFLCQRGQVNVAAHVLLTTLIIYISIGTIAVEGLVDGHPNYVHHWLLVVAMGMLMALYDARHAISLAYLGACCLIYAAIELKWFVTGPIFPFPAWIFEIYPQLTNLPIFVAAMMMTLVFVADIRRAEQFLAFANHKLETLIENMLPPAISNRLRQEGRSFADGVEQCSVLFADIVNFTHLSANMSPQELVELLNRLFSHFDELAEMFGIEKIKTIGDAYMAAAGVPETRADHAERLARFALAMRDLIREYPGLSLRIGINSGPVVAGVIGKKRYIYDLWGDAVNIASRMESHGLPGSIQVSRSTYDLIADKFEFIERGQLDIKGRGKLEAFLLAGEKN